MTAPLDLNSLISQVSAQAPKGDALDALDIALDLNQQLGDLSDQVVSHFVNEARREGHSWTAIGDRMGVTKQAARKRFVAVAEVAPAAVASRRARLTTTALARPLGVATGVTPVASSAAAIVPPAAAPAFQARSAVPAPAPAAAPPEAPAPASPPQFAVRAVRTRAPMPTPPAAPAAPATAPPPPLAPSGFVSIEVEPQPDQPLAPPVAGVGWVATAEAEAAPVADRLAEPQPVVLSVEQVATPAEAPQFTATRAPQAFVRAPAETIPPPPIEAAPADTPATAAAAGPALLRDRVAEVRKQGDNCAVCGRSAAGAPDLELMYRGGTPVCTDCVRELAQSLQADSD